MPSLKLRFDTETEEAITKLIVITGAINTQEFIQDAIRTMEWIIFYQSKNKSIVALSKKAKKVLSSSKKLNEYMSCLYSYIEPNQKQAAKDYFKTKEKDQNGNVK